MMRKCGLYWRRFGVLFPLQNQAKFMDPVGENTDIIECTASVLPDIVNLAYSAANRKQMILMLMRGLEP